MPGFFTAKVMTKEQILSHFQLTSWDSAFIWLMRLKTVCSAKLINSSNILALDGKCRYSAASDTPTARAKDAMVILFPGLRSSSLASTSRICWRRVRLTGE